MDLGGPRRRVQVVGCVIGNWVRWVGVSELPFSDVRGMLTRGFVEIRLGIRRTRRITTSWEGELEFDGSVTRGLCLFDASYGLDVPVSPLHWYVDVSKASLPRRLCVVY